jgi:Glycoside hydrolase 123, catalytic domain
VQATVLILLFGLGGADVWTASPLERVYPDTLRERGDRARIHVYAARGERESFQICIRSNSDTAQNLELETEPVCDDIAAPELRRVGYAMVQSEGGDGAPGVFPDPLLEFAPFPLPPGETCAVWVTYSLPQDAEPGTHKHRLVVRLDGKKEGSVQVKLEVFDFELPASPTLRTLFRLDRMAVCAFYGIDPASLSEWKPFYETLSHHRLSYSVWDPTEFVPMPPRRGAETETLKQHLACAAAVGHMNTIYIGASGGEGIAPFPEHVAGERQDALEVYLNDMGNWLAKQGWLDRACIQAAAMGQRSDWERVRRAYDRVGRLDNRITRLLIGGLQPAFDGCAEAWAIPLDGYNPTAQARLYEGRTLAAVPAHSAERVSASSTAGTTEGLPYDAVPEDGYDGCLLTAWWSQRPPSDVRPEWIEVAFTEPVRTRTLKVGWPFGMETAVVRVMVSYDGERFSAATVRWDHNFSRHRQIPSWSEGRFRTEKTFRAIRLEFTGTLGDTLAGVSELEFDRAPSLERAQRNRPVRLWLASRKEAFPSLRIGAHSAEARLIAWVCWGHELEGFTGGALNRWPGEWAETPSGKRTTWPVDAAGSALLFYPGPRGPAPSIRVEALRDGIEDFEYLAAFENAVRGGAITDKRATELSRRGRVPDGPTAVELDGLARHIQETRVAIGRELTRMARRAHP